MGQMTQDVSELSPEVSLSSSEHFSIFRLFVLVLLLFQYHCSNKQ